MPLVPDLVKPLEAAAGLAKAVTALASVSPGTARSRASRERRARIYSDFQRATQDVIGIATHLKVLAVTNTRSRDRFLRTAMSMADALPFDLIGLQGLTRLMRGAGPVLKLAVAGDLVGDAQHRHATYRATARMRSAVSAFTAAVGEVRLHGHSGPQDHTEEVIVLVGELLGRIAATEDEFRNCQLALGLKLRDFVLAVRVDLDQRWWHVRKRPRSHRWQIWRSPATPRQMWESPDAAAVIADAITSSRIGTPERP